MKKMVVLSSVILMTSCSSKEINQGSTARPELVMAVGTTDAVGTSFYAFLLGDIGREYRFYCPDQLWEFGDGISRYYKRNCNEYDPKDPWIMKRVFRQYYKYEEGGEFEAKLTLIKNGIPVAAAKHTVNIDR